MMCVCQRMSLYNQKGKIHLIRISGNMDFIYYREIKDVDQELRLVLR